LLLRVWCFFADPVYLWHGTDLHGGDTVSSLRRGQPRDEGLTEAVETVESNARTLDGDAIGALADRAADASYVLLGEASHGTSEFYRWRAKLTAELVRRGDVAFVGVEGDWTDCYEVNRHVRGYEGAPTNTRVVLDDYDRWPTWMWANWEVLEFVSWLREYNADRDRADRVGFYGLDVYSLFESMDAVIDYLEAHDIDEAGRVRDAYQCFEPYGEDAREYARSTRLIPQDCEDEVVEVLAELRRKIPAFDADPDPESAFNAEQNALVARNAEAYYRALGEADVNSWNVRDEHMADTLDRLCGRPDVDGTAVVWAHNTHVGDARATDMTDRGEVNLGQLVRERHGSDEAVVVGFGTYRGSVVAANSWGSQMQEMQVPNATETSVEDVFHRADVGDSFLVFDEVEDLTPLEIERGHRAIGVVYHPERELGNYVPTVLPKRYDAFVHVEESQALHPLHKEPTATREPETYPWGV